MSGIDVGRRVPRVGSAGYIEVAALPTEAALARPLAERVAALRADGYRPPPITDRAAAELAPHTAGLFTATVP